MSENTSIVETERAGSVLIIRLASETPRNSLSNPMRDGMSAAFGEAIRDRSVRTVCLMAKGPNFCAGGDLNALDALRKDPFPAHRRFRDMGQWLLPILRIEKPSVAAVRAFAPPPL